MPDRAAAEQFERTIHDLDLIVDELVNSRRRDRILIAGVVIAMVAGGLTTGYVLKELSDQQIETCRESNNRFDALMDILDGEATSDGGRSLVSRMRAASVVDCDSDDNTTDDLEPQR